MRVNLEFSWLTATKDHRKGSVLKRVHDIINTTDPYSRLEDSLDSIRVECIIQNYPIDNNTLQLAEMGAFGTIGSFSDASFFVNNSEVISGNG